MRGSITEIVSIYAMIHFPLSPVLGLSGAQCARSILALQGIIILPTNTIKASTAGLNISMFGWRYNSLWPCDVCNDDVGYWVCEGSWVEV